MMAGVGRAPVAVTSGGQTSNVTFMHLLPTTAMMQGMPGWGQGMMVGEDMSRGHEISDLAYNPANNSALVTDENDDVLRVISLTSNTTVATITLPSGSQAHAVAINGDGTLAAAALSGQASVAIIDLSRNSVTSVVSTGYYPSGIAFAGANLLVTNAAGSTVSVLDSTTGIVTRTVNVGLGAAGIAASTTNAVVANMQAGSVSIVNLGDYSVKSVALPAGTRPYEVVISGSTAVITTPMSNGFLLLDLNTLALKQVSTSTWNGMGPGAVAVQGNNVFIANQMTASVTVADLSGTVSRTFPVDPGPVAIAAVPGKNQLVVLAEGTGTLDVVDLSSYSIVTRVDAGETERSGEFIMPLISSVSPSSAAAGSTVTLTITGSGFQGVRGLDFLLAGTGMGGGMMGGGSMDGGMGQVDANIKVSNLQVNGAGTQLTASVQMSATAAIGPRQIRLQTNGGFVMGMMTNSRFSVTN
jgi:YVTN family beta-propeller protein